MAGDLPDLVGAIRDERELSIVNCLFSGQVLCHRLMSMAYDSSSVAEENGIVAATGFVHALLAVPELGTLDTLRNTVAELRALGANTFYKKRKGAMDIHNQRTLESLTEDDQVIVFLHGLMQNGGPWMPAVRQAEARGYKAIAPTYDYSTTDASEVIGILSSAYARAADVGARVAGIVAHSSAPGYVCRSFTEASLVESMQSHGSVLVFSAPSSGGAYPATGEQRLIRRLNDHPRLQQVLSTLAGDDLRWYDRDDYRTEEGARELLLLNAGHPEGITVYNVLCTSDTLLPVQQGLHLQADHIVIVGGGGHLQGSGVGERLNHIYLDCVARKYEQ